MTVSERSDPQKSGDLATRQFIYWHGQQKIRQQNQAQQSAVALLRLARVLGRDNTPLVSSATTEIAVPHCQLLQTWCKVHQSRQVWKAGQSAAGVNHLAAKLAAPSMFGIQISVWIHLPPLQCVDYCRYVIVTHAIAVFHLILAKQSAWLWRLVDATIHCSVSTRAFSE